MKKFLKTKLENDDKEMIDMFCLHGMIKQIKCKEGFKNNNFGCTTEMVKKHFVNTIKWFEQLKKNYLYGLQEY